MSRRLENDVSCTLGNIAIGTTVTVGIYGTVLENTEKNIDVSNTATVTADNEIDESDNVSTSTFVTADVTTDCVSAEEDDASGCSLIKEKNGGGKNGFGFGCTFVQSLGGDCGF